MPKPLIGITLDIEPQGGGYSSDPWYALRVNYAEAVSAAGGLPVALPHELGLVEDYLERIDALLVSGGMFDIPPELYTGQTQHRSVTTKASRTAFELALLRGALARDMPVLGICGGMPMDLYIFSMPSQSTSSPIIFQVEPSRFSCSRARRPTK